MEGAVADGAWAFGMIAYEAAPALEPAARVHPGRLDVPHLWFGLADGPDPQAPPPTTGEGYALGAWEPDWAEDEHARAVTAVHAAIRRGDTYQVNLTTRLRSRLRGDPWGLYGDLAHRQRGAHHAYLDLGGRTVVSASPESFLTWEDGMLTTRPMKGTRPRGATPGEDNAQRAALLASPKDRAENLMIVDLLRNDLARVAIPGTLEVPELMRAEAYPTLWQLTSTVRARTPAGTTLTDVLGALFPCGSITGAPKISTMDLIARLETSPRSAYCGAIGWIAPGKDPDAPPRARFSVAIRTVVVDGDGSVVYGTGGGVTIDSTPAGEWQELLTKARVLPTGQRDPFALLETLAVRDGRPQHLDAHLERLALSAAHFGIPCDLDRARALAHGIEGTALLRLRLRRDGTLTAEPRELAPAGEPVRLALDTVLTDVPPDVSGHKTTIRDHLTAARERHPEADDVILVDAEGRLLETTMATLAVRRDGRWLTPPLSVGCLPGVGRRLALEAGELTEHLLTTRDLDEAEALAVVSSARGRRPAHLIGAEGPR